MRIMAGDKVMTGDEPGGDKAVTLTQKPNPPLNPYTERQLVRSRPLPYEQFLAWRRRYKSMGTLAQEACYNHTELSSPPIPAFAPV